MKIVIDIPDEVYNKIKDNMMVYVLTDSYHSIIGKAITEGTPLTKGHWIDDADKIDAKYGRHTYKCSKCGKYAEYFVGGTEVWWDRIKPNFCPNCGENKEVENEDSN